jgi:hypothetical protein
VYYAKILSPWLFGNRFLVWWYLAFGTAFAAVLSLVQRRQALAIVTGAIILGALLVARLRSAERAQSRRLIEQFQYGTRMERLLLQPASGDGEGR